MTSTYPRRGYIFRVQGRDAIQAPLMVDEIIKRGWDKVAIFADTTGYGEGGYNDVVDALATKNLKPVHVSRFALGSKDHRRAHRRAQCRGQRHFSYTVGQENAVIANGRKPVGLEGDAGGARGRCRSVLPGRRQGRGRGRAHCGADLHC